VYLTFHATNGRRTSLSARSCVVMAILLLVLCGGYVRADAKSSKQSDPGQADQTRELTIERIYGEPSLSGSPTTGIEWSPDSKRISYLVRDPQCSNTGTELWTMDAATGERKVLVNSETLKTITQPQKTKSTQATGLGRIEPGSYFWSPAGDSLLFAGSTSLVLLDLKTMAPRPLVSGDRDIEDPKFSPDGKWVSFVRDWNLWVVNAATGETKAISIGGSEEILKGKLDWVYPEELDLTTAYWWSPDSSKIAFLEMDERPVTRYPIKDMSSPVGALEYTRFPQAGEPNPIVRVGVARVADGQPSQTKWMDTGADTDVYLARVVWLHNGGRVAIERLNRAQNRLDLLFCDAATGASQIILTDTDKYWINISDDLYFFSDDKRFLWSSERSGFRHYYLYDLSGKQSDQLTGGNWGITGTSGFGPGVVKHPEVDEANGEIYFLSNKDDVTDTQLYQLSLHDKSIARITRETGTHSVRFAPDHFGFEDTYSNEMTPPRQSLFRTNGTRVALINENHVPELAEYHFSPPDFVNVPAQDGTKLSAMTIKPPHFDSSRKYPVLVDVYGGPQEQYVRNTWEGGNFLWLEMMAEKGYIVFRIDNRGSYNRGHAFETSIYHQLGKVELEDQLAGVNYLKSLPYVDGSRMGIWGWSYGAYMTLEAMVNAPDIFKAGVAVAPVTDWLLYDTIYTERYMGRPQEDYDAYKNSSPVNQIANLKGKLMLAHGTGDDNVHFANTAEVLSELIAHGNYPADMLIFPGRGHSIGDSPARIELFQRITEFFLRYL
jgi:dipeptidyl-peptidase 4